MTNPAADAWLLDAFDRREVADVMLGDPREHPKVRDDPDELADWMVEERLLP